MTGDVSEPMGMSRRGVQTLQRRWRLAVLLGLVLLLALAGFAVVLTLQNEQANSTVAVLSAGEDIRAGTTLSAGELVSTNIRVDDPAVLASLVPATDRNRLAGQVATENVRAGSLIPAGLGAPQASAGMWEVPLPVKRMPPDLKPGDHVALVVSATAKTGEPVDYVAMQDVRVLDVRPDSVNLWLPAGATAQMEWYADRQGGIVLAKMPAGATQANLPVGGGS